MKSPLQIREEEAELLTFITDYKVCRSEMGRKGEQMREKGSEKEKDRLKPKKGVREKQNDE